MAYKIFSQYVSKTIYLNVVRTVSGWRSFGSYINKILLIKTEVLY